MSVFYLSWPIIFRYDVFFRCFCQEKEGHWPDMLSFWAWMGMWEALQDAGLMNGRKGVCCARHRALRQGWPCSHHYLPSTRAHERHQWPDARRVERSLAALSR